MVNVGDIQSMGLLATLPESKISRREGIHISTTIAFCRRLEPGIGGFQYFPDPYTTTRRRHEGRTKIKASPPK
jgi:hypothetical protein